MLNEIILIFLFVFIFNGNDIALSVPQSIPALSNLPRDSSDFTGREVYLKKMSSFFQQHKNGILTLTGLSGIGKTQMAKRFLQLSNENYNIIWWFDAQQELEPQFHQFIMEWNATFPNQDEQIPLNKLSLKGTITFMKNVLRKTRHSWILVFDNVESKEAIEPYFPDVHKGDSQRKQILITSQNQNSWQDQEPIATFDEKEGFCFVKKSLGNESDQEIRKLLQTTNSHPFYLAQAVEHIKSHGISIDSYLKIYKEKGFLKEKIKDLKVNHPQAYSVLVFLTLFNGDHLPQVLLERFIATMNFDADLVSLIKILKQNCLIEETEKKDQVSKFYSIHDIIKNIIMSEISAATKKLYVTKSITLLLEDLEKRWDKLVDFATANPEMMARANVLWNIAQKDSIKNAEVFRLGKVLLEYHIYRTRNHMEHEILHDQLGSLLETLHEDKLDPKALNEYYIDSVYVRKIYFSPELIKKTEEKLQKALQYFKSSESDEYLRALYNLSHFYLFQGKIDQAKKYIKDGEKIVLEAKSPINKNMLWYSKSWLYLEAGEFKESKEALDNFFQSFPEEQYFCLTFYGMNMRAEYYYANSEYDMALKCAQDTVKGANKYFQTEYNQITAEALTIIAKSMIEKKRLNEAEKAISKALKIYAQYFGGEGRHGDQATSHLIFGSVLEKGNKDKEAMQEYQKAAEIYRNLYKENIAGVNFLGELFEKMVLMGIKLKREDITHEYLKFLIKYFGMSNERTKRVLETLDEKDLPSTL
jgi:tetratricopeptide (TPR) repeat protein